MELSKKAIIERVRMRLHRSRPGTISPESEFHSDLMEILSHDPELQIQISNFDVVRKVRERPSKSIVAIKTDRSRVVLNLNELH